MVLPVECSCGMYYGIYFVIFCIELLCIDKMVYKHCTMYAYNSSWIETIARHWLDSLLCCNHGYVPLGIVTDNVLS